MNKIRKTVIAVYVFALTLAMAVTVYANAASITIENAVAGQTYDAYRVFDADDSDQTGSGGTYKISSKFSAFPGYTYNMDGKSVAMTSFFTVGDNDILDISGLSKEEDMQVFSNAVLDFAKSNGIANDGSTCCSEDDMATISVSEYGLYIIDSSLGDQSMWVWVDGENNYVREKNGIPGIDLKITHATNSKAINQEKTGNGAQIGDIVDFTISANLKARGSDYSIVSTMTQGLSLVDVQDSDISFSDNRGLGYAVDNAYVDHNGNRGFKIIFDEKPSADVTVSVAFQAVVNDEAAITAEQNVIDAFLIYGNGTETTHVNTETSVYPLQIKKIAMDGSSDVALSGAAFEIFRAFDQSKLAFSKVSDTKYRVDPEGTVSSITTVAENPVLIEGLGSEDYIFVETQAPEKEDLIEASVIVDGTTFRHAQKVTVLNTSKIENVQIATIKDGAEEKESISATVTFKVLYGFWDDGSSADKTVSLTGFEGDILKLKAEDIPAVGSKPSENRKAGSWDAVPDTDTAITKDTVYTYTYDIKENQSTTNTETKKNQSITEPDSEKKADQKIANPLKIKGKKVKIRYRKLEKKEQKLTVSKLIKFKKDAGDQKKFVLSSAKKGKKSFKKSFKINQSTGKITVKKGLKKGTYKLKIKVKALGNEKYLASDVKTVTIQLRIR